MSTTFNADIDIDVAPLTDKNKYGVGAVIYKNGNLNPHPSGYYVNTNMGIDGISERAAMDYKSAEEAGYIKLDLLTNNVLGQFNDKSEYLDALHTEPDWDLLLEPEKTKHLPQISSQNDILDLVRPRSVIELADVLALIRPGKRHLLDSYLRNREQVRQNLYRKPKSGVYFKKSHAVSYAMMIVAVLNKIDDVSLLKF